jgi:hypothetical protein
VLQGSDGFLRIRRLSSNPLAHGRRRQDAHGDLTDSFLISSRGPILNEGREGKRCSREVHTLTKSPNERLRSRDRPVSSRSSETRRDVRVRSRAVLREHRVGDIDVLDCCSDLHLLAIRARGAKRELEVRETGQFRNPPH